MRWAIVVCHRRFGKTVLAVNHLIRAAMRSTSKDSRYAYLAPTYAQGKAVAWDYLKHYSRPIPGVKVNESELRIEYPNGSRIRIYGCDNPDSLRGLYLDGAVLDEYALMSPRVFAEIISPALSDRKGWAIFIGTPWGHNHFYDLLEMAQADSNWLTAIYKASETGIIDPDELARLKSAMSIQQYQQELECSFDGAIQGAYYAEQIEQAEKDGRITSIPYDSRLEVETFWDLGMNDSTAIWFMQTVGREIRLIDYYEASGAALEHYVKTLKEKGYNYGKHNLPHDAEVRELGTGKSRMEMLQSMGLRNTEIVPKLSIEDGIEAARVIFSRCWFDKNKCKDGLNALKNYRKEFDEKRNTFKPRPLHDWASNGADSFRYFAVGFKDNDFHDYERRDRYAMKKASGTSWMSR